MAGAHASLWRGARDAVPRPSQHRQQASVEEDGLVLRRTLPLSGLRQQSVSFWHSSFRALHVGGLQSKAGEKAGGEAGWEAARHAQLPGETRQSSWAKQLG